LFVFQALGFIPVGITNASEDIKQLAQKLELPYFISTRLHVSTQKKDEPNGAVVEAEAPALEVVHMETDQSASTESHDEHELVPETTGLSPSPVQPPMVVYNSVRSGQQIFAQHRSLVVLGNVNSGAEVLADGDIYVMGALKGRALAGIGGDVRARITCQSFDAELVSIAHHFTTCDDLAALPQNGDLRLLKPTTVCVQDDQLHFQSTL
jgi:septum site-determining protein MinC